jgi:hypothetical protein
MTQRLHFYATRDDLIPWLASVERALPVDYVRMANSPVGTAQAYAMAADIPALGHASSPSAGTGERFLVVRKSHRVVVRRVAADDGRTRYCFDQLANPDSITFAPGGLYGTDVLLHGGVATASQSADSLALMKVFAKPLRASFRRIKAYWVGPEAEALLDGGARLTISAHAPTDFDLTRR